MNKISMDKKYKTRDGNFEAKPLIINMNYDDYPVACLMTSLKDGSQYVAKFSKHGGFYWDDSANSLDLIEVSPYADIPIDAKVLVWYSDDKKIKRHFAGVSESGKPMAWAGGHTSFTSDYPPAVWDFCELYTGE